MIQNVHCKSCGTHFLLKLLLLVMASRVSHSANFNEEEDVQYVIRNNFGDSKNTVNKIDSTRKPVSYDSSFLGSEENFHRVNEVKVSIRNESLASLWINVTKYTQIRIDFKPVVDKLWDDNTIHVIIDEKVHNSLKIHNYQRNCHYESIMDSISASVSNCFGTLEGIIIVKDQIFVLDNSTALVVDNESLEQDRLLNLDNVEPDIDFANNMSLHIIMSGEETNDTEDYGKRRSKRSTVNNQEDKKTYFCGVNKVLEQKNELKPSNIHRNAAVYYNNNNAYVSSHYMGNHVVEIALFVDQYLWERFYREYGYYKAYAHLQDFVATTLNNVQIFYQHSSFLPKINFKVVRYEVFKTQPYELRGIVDAEHYLNAFCNYQMRWGGRNWDQAIIYTGVDISRNYNDRTISGIARMNGVCDPRNSCLVAEAFDFRAAFITAHELGHALGMNHDEKVQCGNSFIMSESLGAGKVVWSTCSINDFQKFVHLLNNEKRNCLVVQNHNSVLSIQDSALPGQKYDSNRQCEMVFGKNYYEVKGQLSPQIVGDACHMIWCHHRNGGILHASHPALEGTSCGHGRYCISGKCIAAPNPPLAPIHGEWTSWHEPDCASCRCSRIANSIPVIKARRSCTNPSPKNGGRQCEGGSSMGILCHNSVCPSKSQQQSLEDFLREKCKIKKREQNNADLLGSGAQLLYSDDRACKVFCVVNTPRGVKSFRFLGDYLPDGVSCGKNKYCLDGKCLPRMCDNRMLLPSSNISCNSIAKRCHDVPVTPKVTSATAPPAAERFVWTDWSEWSSCTSACDVGVKTRTRQCYGERTYKTNNGKCYGPDAEKIPCRGDRCPVVRPKHRQQRREVVVVVAKEKSSPTTTSTSATTAFTLPTWKESYGEYSRWSEWSACNVTCGEGVQFRYRTCRYAMECLGDKVQHRPCYPKLCTAWGGWGYWSTCSSSDNTRRRIRQCYGDQTYETCPGSHLDVQRC